MSLAEAFPLWSSENTETVLDLHIMTDLLERSWLVQSCLFDTLHETTDQICDRRREQLEFTYNSILSLVSEREPKEALSVWSKLMVNNYRCLMADVSDIVAMQSRALSGLHAI